MKRIMKKVLMELFHIPAPSGKELGVQVYIVDFLNKLKVKYTMDGYGNIFNIDQKDKPLVVAHMDTVQRMSDALAIQSIKLIKGVIKGEGVIGGDDKCGIFIILYLLYTRKLDFNFLFTVGEETGAIGSRGFVAKRDLSEISYGLILDRNGNTDILCTMNDYGTDDFENMLYWVGEAHGYSPAMGTFSDADELRDLFSCTNLSVGYYDAHTKKEYVVVEDLMNAYRYVMDILDSVKGYFSPAIVPFDDLNLYFTNDDEMLEYVEKNYKKYKKKGNFKGYRKFEDWLGYDPNEEWETEEYPSEEEKNSDFDNLFNSFDDEEEEEEEMDDNELFDNSDGGRYNRALDQWMMKDKKIF